MTIPALSKRLQAVADLVPATACIADIGTDHGYIPIYLVSRNIADRAVAADLRPGPLSAAEANVWSCGLSDRISLKLSDGLNNISPEEADVIVIAGMGGMLTIRILSEGRELMKSAKTCILEPQSDLDSVRRFLLSEGMIITDEKMVLDAEKYYTVMKAEYAGDSCEARDPKACGYDSADLKYGKVLIDAGDPVLEEKLETDKKKTAGILRELKCQVSGETEESGPGPANVRIMTRIKELWKELFDIDEALLRIRRKQYFENK